AIFKATERCRTVTGCTGGAEVPGGGGVKGQAPTIVGNPRINRVVLGIPDPPTLGSWVNPVGSTSGAAVISNGGGTLNTNYSGPSTLFGDVVALASGGCNVLYA